MVTQTAIGAIKLRGWRFRQQLFAVAGRPLAPDRPATVAGARMASLNTGADELGLDLGGDIAGSQSGPCAAGQETADGATADRFARHTTGQPVGGFTMLGDGRAICGGNTGRRPAGSIEIQLKGAGPTRFSRRADGLAASGRLLRETSSMKPWSAIGIPTTRSLAVVTLRTSLIERTALKRGNPDPRGRQANFGSGPSNTWSRQTKSKLRALADLAIRTSLTGKSRTPGGSTWLFLRGVIDRSASLSPKWTIVG